MKKKLLLVGAMALMTLPSLAQSVKIYPTGTKWDPSFDAVIQGQTTTRLNARSVENIDSQSSVEGIVNVNDAEAVAKFVNEAGGEATIINDGSVVVNLPATKVKDLAMRADVNYLSAPTQFRPLLHNVRPETGVTKVTTGEGLETPFTGKGVVVGIIDQGFEYAHPAFADRVSKYGAIDTGATLTTTQPTKDKHDDYGHATHVANIAAGSPVGDNPDYGIATGADLVFISSNFQSTSVLKQAQAIKKYAEGEGKPWVINMSFGGITGPHDGSTQYDQDMSKLCGEGGIMVAAMGNEGGSKMHAERDFTEDNQTYYLYVKPATANTNKVIVTDVWGKATDGVEHLTITPVLVTSTKIYPATVAQMTAAGMAPKTGINALNNRQYYSIIGYLPQLASVLGVTGSTYYFMWQVKGNAGDGFHAWVDGASSYASEFAATVQNNCKATSGDDNYLVGEGAASIPTAIAVASYNADFKYVNQYGTSCSYLSSVGAKGAISKFSSPGPQIVSGVAKPAIAAPGGVICSAFSKNATSFKVNNQDITNVVTVNGNNYYYGCMNGTSMASPAVTGIVALWLEANPKLTYADILEIFKQTGRRDSNTGAADADGWNARAGYGKIDAYEGLKLALKMATGINETLNTTAPVSFDKGSDAWRVLFNNDETYANLQVIALNGTCVKRQYIQAPRRGDEAVVQLKGLQPGVYLLQVQTTAASLTRKVVVK